MEQEGAHGLGGFAELADGQKGRRIDDGPLGRGAAQRIVRRLEAGGGQGYPLGSQPEAGLVEAAVGGGLIRARPRPQGPQAGPAGFGGRVTAEQLKETIELQDSQRMLVHRSRAGGRIRPTYNRASGCQSTGPLSPAVELAFRFRGFAGKSRRKNIARVLQIPVGPPMMSRSSRTCSSIG